MGFFADSIRINTGKMKAEINRSVVEVAADLFKNTVKESPVLKGVLVNNWYTAEGAGVTDFSFVDANRSLTGTDSLARVAALVASRQFAGKDGEISFSNSTPYAYRAEYIGWPEDDPDSKGWTGKVGPYAMVRKALVTTSTKYK